MSFEISARFALPLLQSGQAQKEIFHNEAITLLDLISQATAIDADIDTPPEAPQPGQAWIVGATPVGAWAGQANAIAGWSTGGWRFVTPIEGMAVWIEASGLIARFGDGEWSIGSVTAARIVVAGKQVVGARAAEIAAPAGGSIIDSESRTAITQILAMLRAHGLIEG